MLGHPVDGREQLRGIQVAQSDVGAYALLKERTRQDGLRLSTDSLSEQLRLHLHRGISLLAGDTSLRDISSLPMRAVSQNAEQSQHS